MDEWVNIVVRQLILYSLPVLVSLTIITWIESRLTRKPIPQTFFSINWRGTWLPLLASLAWHRGIIIALPKPLSSGVKAAVIRCLAHGLLCLLGFCLFSWSLAHAAPTGLPPLHHWWAKVLMFFNLCMFSLHLVPLPGFVAGECLLASKVGHTIRPYFNIKHGWIVWVVLAASPLLDIGIGTWIVFPAYESISTMAMQLSR